MKKQILFFLFCLIALSERPLRAADLAPTSKAQTDWLAYSVLATGLFTLGYDVRKAVKKFNELEEQKKEKPLWADEKDTPDQLHTPKQFSQSPFINEESSKNESLYRTKKFIHFYADRLFSQYKCAPFLVGVTLTTLATVKIASEQMSTSTDSIATIPLKPKTSDASDAKDKKELDKDIKSKDTKDDTTSSKFSPPAPPPPPSNDLTKKDDPKTKSRTDIPLPKIPKIKNKEEIKKELAEKLMQKRDKLNLDDTTEITKELLIKIESIKETPLKNAVYNSFTLKQQKQKTELQKAKKGSKEHAVQEKKSITATIASLAGNPCAYLKKTGKNGDDARNASKAKIKEQQESTSLADTLSKAIDKRRKQVAESDDKKSGDEDADEWN
jgi:hypothetical protein